MELSFTRYRVYRECPWKYRFLFVEGRKIPLNPKSSFGLSLHRALEQWLSGGERSLESLLSCLDRSWLKDGYPDEKAAARWKAKAERALADFHRAEESRRSRLAGVEREFVWELGPHQVRGMIDRLDQAPDGGYEIVDYKTGPGVPSPAQVAGDLQLRFYALGLRRGPGLEPRTLIVDCVAAGERVSAPYDPSGEEKLAADLSVVADAIESQRFEPDTSFCARCDFRRDCPHSAAP